MAVNCPPTFDKKVSGAIFFQRSVSTHCRHSDMDLGFPIPVIGKVALSIQNHLLKCRLELLLSDEHQTLA